MYNLMLCIPNLKEILKNAILRGHLCNRIILTI